MERSVIRANLAILLTVALLTVGCGGGGSDGSDNKPTIGPNAVLNGSSLSTANSNWIAQNCGVQVEITADGGFFSVVHDLSGTTSSGGGTWTASDTSGLVGSGFDGGLGGFFWVAALTHIAGSTSSSTFSAGTTVQTQDTQQSLGTCTFTLQQGVIPGS